MWHDLFMESKYYSREVKTPANKKEGLENFIQMIINQLEGDKPENAIYTAVDLLQDVRFGTYDNIETGNIVGRLHSELDAKHQLEIVKTREGAFAAGQASARMEMAKRLGLVLA